MKKLLVPVNLLCGFGLIVVLNAFNLIIPVCIVGMLLSSIWLIFSES